MIAGALAVIDGRHTLLGILSVSLGLALCHVVVVLIWSGNTIPKPVVVDDILDRRAHCRVRMQHQRDQTLELWAQIKSSVSLEVLRLVDNEKLVKWILSDHLLSLVQHRDLAEWRALGHD